MVRQHRLYIWGRPATPWCFDRQLVRDIAIERGVMSYDAGCGSYFIDIGCHIRTREVEAEKVIVKLKRRAA